MRTSTKDDVCVVKRCDLTKKHLPAVSSLLPVFGSAVVGYFIHSFRVRNPALNVVHGCATDVQGSIYAAGMKTGTIHVSEAGNAERNHKCAFVGYRADGIPPKASIGSNNTR